MEIQRTNIMDNWVAICEQADGELMIISGQDNIHPESREYSPMPAIGETLEGIGVVVYTDLHDPNRTLHVEKDDRGEWYLWEERYIGGLLSAEEAKAL